MDQQNVQNLREKIQSDIVTLITERIKEGKMSQDRAQQIAQMVLEQLPEDITLEELYKIVPKLDDQFHELAEVVVPVMVEYEKKVHKTLEENVLQLVRDKKFKEAIQEARRGIEIEKQLT